MSLQGAASSAREAIAVDDLDRLRRLLDEHPQLLSWRDENGDVLLQATTSYANFPGAEHEAQWNRQASAELLIDAGALVDPRVYLRVMTTGAHRMLAMMREKGVLPENLRVLAALGDSAAVRACFDETGRLLERGRPSPQLRAGYEGAQFDWPDPADDALVVADAFLVACRLGHRDIASWLLERCVANDADLARRTDGWDGDESFVDFLLASVPEGTRFDLEKGNATVAPSVIWQRAVDLRLHAALQSGNVGEVNRLLAAEPFVLGEAFVSLQAKLLQVAAFSEGALSVIEAVLGSDAAINSLASPPDVRAVSYALEYGHADYVPLLATIWRVPDDLPHAAAMGDMAKVVRWFDEDGRPQLGDLSAHNPFPDHHPRVTEQDVLDRSLAWAVQNAEYGVADFLLQRGADINTRWSTHEPASILHECAGHGRMEQVRYLVARGIDVTLRDARFAATAAEWASFGGHDEIAAYLQESGG